MHNKARPIRQVLFTLFVVAVLALPALSLGAAPRPGRYAGETAQGKRVTVAVTRSARRVKAFRILYRVRCEDGSKVGVFFRYTNLGIRRGRFAGVGRSVQRTDDGTRVVHRVRVFGRFASRNRVVGRWTGRVEMQRSPTVNCAVRSMRWSAER
jgi:hypothetical protein